MNKPTLYDYGFAIDTRHHFELNAPPWMVKRAAELSPSAPFVLWDPTISGDDTDYYLVVGDTAAELEHEFDLHYGFESDGGGQAERKQMGIGS